MCSRAARWWDEQIRDRIIEIGSEKLKLIQILTRIGRSYWLL